MPNICENALQIRGTQEALGKLNEDCKGNFSFGAFFPVPVELKDRAAALFGKPSGSPEELEGLQAKFGATDWYQWQMAHWESKWDVKEAVSQSEIAAGEIVLRFDTPWRPPITFCKKLSERYPELEVTIAYAEGGMAFYGVGTFCGGKADSPLQMCMVGTELGADAALLPGIKKNFWAEKPEDVDEDDWFDLEEEERLTPACSAHLDAYCLGTGG